MANVNIANNTWSISRQTTNISVTADSSSVYFIMDGSSEMRCAKACVAIDAGKYNNVTLACNITENVATNNVYFGVFDSMTAQYYYNTEYDNGISSSSLSGIGVTSIDPNYSGTISINIPSSVTGTKYVGFLFYGNTWNASARPRRRINISSLTATERGYTVSYDANGGSNAPSSQQKIQGTNLMLTDSIPTPPSREDVTYTITYNANGGYCNVRGASVTGYIEYDFVCWNSKIDGTGYSYNSGGTYSQDEDIVLYAQYSANHYPARTMVPTPTRENYDFLGWATDPYATSGITGGIHEISESAYFYAIWKRRDQVYIFDNTGEFCPYQVLIYDDSGWNQYIPYIYTESGWEIYSG